jgi:hypothetical protein
MFDSQNRLSGKYKYLFGFIILSFISIICLAFGSAGSDDFDISRREVLLRRIGHEILLQSGDSTSRVLPVQKISDNEYVISFENALTFQPDLLVNTTRRLLANDPLSGDYVVNVLNCGDTSVTYGYAVSENGKDDIVACTGRVQPKACYTINIKFKPVAMNVAKSGYLIGILPFLALGGFMVFRLNRPKRILPGTQPLPTGVLTIGTAMFNPIEKQLLIDEKVTELTGTETRLLHIFALSPNETIERSRLQKEIWEDEGVIVGRSLDMFISKLRKKLEGEPNANIVVVRGKGYKLEITS